MTLLERLRARTHENVLLHVKGVFEEDESRWCRRGLFLSREGKACRAREAVQCCILGGLRGSIRDRSEASEREFLAAYRALEQTLPHGLWPRKISHCNDSMGFHEILEWLDRASTRV